MSAINLSGNASGSGTFTIASPNSNTSYTLALPEEAGTITTSNSPYSTFRNRIINGNMVIDQRNAGASVTVNNVNQIYTLDRWFGGDSGASVFTIQQSTTAPSFFTNSLQATVTTQNSSIGASDFAGVVQAIEGLNIADLGWGTANAKTVTVSFWVRSSLTGTFGGSLRNGSANRSYPFTYAISVADTWEYKTVTIAGDTSGTWLTTNGIGIYLTFSLGAGATLSGTAGAWNSNNNLTATGAVSVIGTLNATWYITGVQLEVGSVATPFERIDYGRQLIQCQRYCFKFSAGDNYQRYGGGVNGNTTQSFPAIQLPTVMRANPTLTTTGTASNYAIYTGAAVIACSAVPIIDSSSDDVIRPTLQTTVSSGLTQGNYTDLISNNNTTSYLLFSAEL